MFFITYIEAEIKMSNKICILGLQEFKDGGWEEGKERDGQGKIEESEGRGKVEKRERQDIKEGGMERGKGKGEGGRGDEYFIFPGCIITSVLLIRTALRVLCHRCINMVKVRNILKEYCNRFTYKLIHNLQEGFYKNVVFTIFQGVL